MKKFIPLIFLVGCISYEPPKSQRLDYVATASAMNGLDEHSARIPLNNLTGVDPAQTEWCAAFVNSILHLHNIQGSESVNKNPLLARSFLGWGISASEPRYGDIVVFKRAGSSWKGHVGFYIDTVYKDGVKYYRVLGGNQNNQIGYDEYPTSRLLGIRRLPE